MCLFATHQLAIRTIRETMVLRDCQMIVTVDGRINAKRPSMRWQRSAWPVRMGQSYTFTLDVLGSALKRYA